MGSPFSLGQNFETIKMLRKRTSTISDVVTTNVKKPIVGEESKRETNSFDDAFAKIAMRIQDSSEFPLVIETDEDKQHVEKLLQRAIGDLSKDWKIEYSFFSHTCLVPCSAQRYNELISKQRQEYQRRGLAILNKKYGDEFPEYSTYKYDHDVLSELETLEEEMYTVFSLSDFIQYHRFNGEKSQEIHIEFSKDLFGTQWSGLSVEKHTSQYYEKVTRTLYCGTVTFRDIQLPISVQVGGKIGSHLSRCHVWGETVSLADTVANLRETLVYEITNPARILDRQLEIARKRFRPDVYC